MNFHNKCPSIQEGIIKIVDYNYYILALDCQFVKISILGIVEQVERFQVAPASHFCTVLIVKNTYAKAVTD